MNRDIVAFQREITKGGMLRERNDSDDIPEVEGELRQCIRDGKSGWDHPELTNPKDGLLSITEWEVSEESEMKWNEWASKIKEEQ